MQLQNAFASLVAFALQIAFAFAKSAFALCSAFAIINMQVHPRPAGPGGGEPDKSGKSDMSGMS